MGGLNAVSAGSHKGSGKLGGASVTLTDGEPPKVKAFYKVVVSVP